MESGKPFRNPTVHPTEIRTSISPSSAVELNTTSAISASLLQCKLHKAVFDSRIWAHLLHRQIYRAMSVSRISAHLLHRQFYRAMSVSRISAHCFIASFIEQCLFPGKEQMLESHLLTATIYQDRSNRPTTIHPNRCNRPTTIYPNRCNRPTTIYHNRCNRPATIYHKPFTTTDVIDPQPFTPTDVIGPQPFTTTDVINQRPPTTTDVIAPQPFTPTDVIDSHPFTTIDVIDLKPSTTSDIIDTQPSTTTDSIGQKQYTTTDAKESRTINITKPATGTKDVTSRRAVDEKLTPTTGTKDVTSRRAVDEKLTPTTGTKDVTSRWAVDEKRTPTTGTNVIRPLTTDETVGPITGTPDARLPPLSGTSPSRPSLVERRHKTTATKQAPPVPQKRRSLSFNVLEDSKRSPDKYISSRTEGTTLTRLTSCDWLRARHVITFSVARLLVQEEKLTVPFPKSRVENGKTVKFSEPANEGATMTPNASSPLAMTSPTDDMKCENLIKTIEYITAQRDRCLTSRAIDLETIDSQKKQMAAMREQMNQLSETDRGRAIETHLQKEREYMSALEEKDALVASLKEQLADSVRKSQNNEGLQYLTDKIKDYREKLKEKDESIESLEGNLKKLNLDHLSEISKLNHMLENSRRHLEYKDAKVKIIQKKVSETLSLPLKSIYETIEFDKRTREELSKYNHGKEAYIALLKDKLEESDRKVEQIREQALDKIARERDQYNTVIENNKLLISSLKAKLSESILKTECQRSIRTITTERDRLNYFLRQQKYALEKFQKNHRETLAKTGKDLDNAHKMIVEANNKFKSILEEKYLLVKLLNSKLEEFVPKSKFNEMVEKISEERDNYKRVVEIKNSEITSFHVKMNDFIKISEHQQVINTLVEEKMKYMSLLEDKELVISNLHRELMEASSNTQEALVYAYNWFYKEKEKHETILKAKEEQITHLIKEVESCNKKIEEVRAEAVIIVEQEKDRIKTSLEEKEFRIQGLTKQLLESVPRFQFERAIQSSNTEREKYQEIIESQKSVIERLEGNYFKDDQSSKRKLEEIIENNTKETDKYKELLKEKDAYTESLHANLNESIPKSDHEHAIRVLTKERNDYKVSAETNVSELELLRKKLADSLPKSKHDRVIELITNEKVKYKVILDEKETMIRDLNIRLTDYLKDSQDKTTRDFTNGLNERNNYKALLKQKESEIEYLKRQLEENMLIAKKECNQRVELITVDRDQYKKMLESNELELASLKAEVLSSVTKSEFNATVQSIYNDTDTYRELLENQDLALKHLSDEFKKSIGKSNNNMQLAVDLVIKENERYASILKDKETLIASQEKELAKRIPKSVYDDDIAGITEERDTCKSLLKEKETDIAFLNYKLERAVDKLDHERFVELLTKENKKYELLLQDKDSLIDDLKGKLVEDLNKTLDSVVQTIKLSEEEINHFKTELKSKDSTIAQLHEQLMSSVDKAEHDKAIALHHKEIDQINASLARKERLSQPLIETIGDARVQTRDPVSRDPKRDQLNGQNLETEKLCYSNKQSADKQPRLCEGENGEVCPKKISYKINDVAGNKQFGKREEKDCPNLEHIDNKEHNGYSYVHLRDARRVQKHLAETIIELARQRDESVSTLKTKQVIIDSLAEKIDKKQSNGKSSIGQQEIDSDLKKSHSEIDNYINLELGTSKKTCTLSESSDSIKTSSYSLSEASEPKKSSSYLLRKASYLGNTYYSSESSTEETSGLEHIMRDIQIKKSPLARRRLLMETINEKPSKYVEGNTSLNKYEDTFTKGYPQQKDIGLQLSFIGLASITSGIQRLRDSPDKSV
uniref:Uncharacterized protein n=1 Tax=Timema cristinae TaxID=61476 RepID=A0A7R9CER9_TIMCR|nr:unnamed protein product [Timema cristinae]